VLCFRRSELCGFYLWGQDCGGGDADGFSGRIYMWGAAGGYCTHDVLVARSGGGRGELRVRCGVGGTGLV